MRILYCISDAMNITILAYIYISIINKHTKKTRNSRILGMKHTLFTQTLRAINSFASRYFGPEEPTPNQT